MKSASVLSTQTLRVLNLGASGALVEGALPLPPNAEYRMQLVLEGHVTETTVKIRRVAEVGREGGALRYQIGLEFLSMPAEAQEVIEQIVKASEARI